MVDFDLDRLGDVWRQQPDPEEMARLQRTAIAVARRARLSTILDVCAAVAVAAVVVFLVITNPKLQTMVMGSAAILVLLGSNIRLRRLRQVELRGLTGTTEDMLDQSITRVETTVRHHRFTLYTIPPVLLGTFIFAATAAPERRAILGAFGDIAWFRTGVFAVSVAALIALAVYLIIFIRRGRRGLNRLNAMREAYRQERNSSVP
jgi:hypothetical protein